MGIRRNIDAQTARFEAAPERRCESHAARAFTLVELMVSVATIAVLVSMLLPAIRTVVTSTRGFKCQMAQRDVAFSFSVFADDSLHGNRGNSDLCGPHQFTLENFQDSQYQVDEFWPYGDETFVDMPDDSGNDPMRCPEVSGAIRLTPRGCTQGGVTPPELVSFTFNMRLHIADTQTAGGWVQQPLRLTSRILNHPNVPLLWDVDALRAVGNHISPLFTGPAVDQSPFYANDRLWYPAMRHVKKANFAFVDGHVKESTDPTHELGWGWSYRP